MIRTQSVNGYKSISSAYILLIPTVVLLVLSLAIAPLLVHGPDFSLVSKLFLEERIGGLNPEPLEDFRYILAITIVPTTFLLLMVVCQIKLTTKTILFWAITVQLVLLAFLFKNAVIGNNSPELTPYGTYFFCAGIILFTILVAISLLYNKLFKKINLIEKDFLGSAQKLLKHIPWFIAILYTLIRILPSISLNKEAIIDNYHLAYAMGEYAAIFNGHTSLVSFFPQYQNLLPYLTIPVFNIFGFSIATLSITISSLLLIGMMSIYQRCESGKPIGGDE